MQYLNDDNLDELFRRAADSYPLNTDSSAWDKVSAGVQTDQEAARSTGEKTKKQSYRKYLWLLLLLPLSWICTNRFFMNDSKEIDGNTISQKKAPVGTAGSTSTETLNTPEKQTLSKPKTSVAQASAEQPANKTTISGSKKAKHSDLAVASNGPQNDVIHNHRNPDSRMAAARLHTQVGPSSSQDDKSSASKGRMSSTQDLNEPTIKGYESKLSDKSIDKANKTTGDQQEQRPDSSLIANTKKTATNTTTTTAHDQGVNAAVPVAKKPGVAASGANPMSKKSSHFLYVGVIGGLDLSTVDFQAVKNNGFSGGVLIGYQLTKKLSFETGLSVDKKFYYTEGKYFSTKNLYVQPGLQILDASGNCYMFDLPLNIKYNWKSTAKSQWFSTVGLSTYFMKNEKYQYSVDYWGQDTTLASSYNNSSTTWFGQINLSGGYMHTLGKAGSLRIEPYLKIPIHGLGVGNLSIWSGGLYLSFIKTLF